MGVERKETGVGEGRRTGERQTNIHTFYTYTNTETNIYIYIHTHMCM